MNAIGIGGAGGKLALGLDPEATAVNVSQTELDKLGSQHPLLAVVHSDHGQVRGSRKNPAIGSDAYASIKRELLRMIPHNILFTSTGGGTGNGITGAVLADLSAREDVPSQDKTLFVLVLPCARLESAEFVNNTVQFLRGPVSDAIDSGNTGNIFLFSNSLKYDSRLTEAKYNEMLLDSLRVFLAVPEKGQEHTLVEGHIDHEDFELFTSRPYFNHFTYFDYDPEADFGKQLAKNSNPLLLPPESPIEALFLLEVPASYDSTCFYDILQYFVGINVSPVYSVLENPEREKPFLTVSLLYSRKPAELVADFNEIAEEHTRAKVRKSLEQNVSLPTMEVNLEREAKQAAKQQGTDDADVLSVLRRIGKL